MKRLITSILLASLAVLTFAQSPLAEANDLCQSGKYAEATAKYEDILATGRESASLYYNLGYCYYKQSQLGRAALNFERARRLAPADEDILFNLEQIYASTDKMEVLEPVFFVRWWQQFKDLLSSDGWAAAFIALLVLTLAGVLLFFFSDEVFVRKSGFFGALLCLVLAIGAISFSLEKRSEIIDSRAAIIMSPSVSLSSSPDKNATQMAVLHEGTHVDIVSRLGDWCEVRLKDGNIGWLRAVDIELI